MKPKKNIRGDAKERILDVSEKLFAEGSYASVSVRTVTTEAKVNLSAVNYYFGSKQGLFQAVYVRRAKQMNHERLCLLAKAEEQSRAEGRDVTLKEILGAILTPPIFWLYDQEKGLSGYIRFLARAYLEEASDMNHVLRQEVDVFDRFVPYLQKINPGLSEEDIYWDIHFTMGTMHHTINHLDRISLLSHKACKVGTREQTRDRLVNFCAEGFAGQENAG
ncbi:TetR/AcrR family transcriptional regulator [Paremcibacter congregatus]|uniref:TetR/AcrR family transcriptional regulator n=1 Tax=Paremcibacter congregatus TaxID=2043170 RepID=UPI0030EF7E3D|tara:strand:- start:5791 stop:6450 length:660 start_codon:yes stop_codon:yes gene_type:complete